MKIAYCPVCKGKLKRDYEADDDAEGGNYHSLVGHNYSCPAGHSFAIIGSNDREY